MKDLKMFGRDDDDDDDYVVGLTSKEVLMKDLKMFGRDDDNDDDDDDVL